ncbi:MAG: glutathione S-transferase family protein [Deltaproteobacteria bacterium]|nr:glutathione S-transferase family protein [Deltaproteobacteria bacterium]
MGQLVDGVWQVGGLGPEKRGAFERAKTKFRSTEISAEPARYHLYASYACPWAQRTLITRALRGLEHAIDVTIVDWRMGDDGWVFGGDGEDDPLFGAKLLRDVYLQAAPRYTGRVTVPVLWDKKAKTIVNNESREIMRLFDTAFDAIAENPKTLAPASLLTEIDATLDAIYEPYNNGVYRAGFSTSQDAYEAACRDVFSTLDRVEELLSRQRYLCGSVLTEADVAFFTTSLRFDLVYYAHFKCNVRRLADYPNVWGFVRELYQMPEIRKTCRLDHIKQHYYWSQTNVNPHRLVPLGPTIDFDAPHGRDSR